MAVETTRADEASAHRIPSLDGLRALSIFLVLALHSIFGRSQLDKRRYNHMYTQTAGAFLRTLLRILDARTIQPAAFEAACNCRGRRRVSSSVFWTILQDISVLCRYPHHNPFDRLSSFWSGSVLSEKL